MTRTDKIKNFTSFCYGAFTIITIFMMDKNFEVQIPIVYKLIALALIVSGWIFYILNDSSVEKLDSIKQTQNSTSTRGTILIVMIVSAVFGFTAVKYLL